MPMATQDAAAPDAPRPRRGGRGLFWAMLAAIVVLAVVGAVAFGGWNTALQRADAQTDRAARLQAAADSAAGLQQRVAALQSDLTDARAQQAALQAKLADSQAALADARGKAATAGEEAAAAKGAASDAEQARAALQARLDAAPAPATSQPTGNTAPQPASNISAATAQSDVAPALPLPGLPAGATGRDYLVAAQQAVRQGENGRAQSALEHAETRLLNQASLARPSARPASHPGVAEIEQALDQLGAGDTDAALRTIDVLLARP